VNENKARLVRVLSNGETISKAKFAKNCFFAFAPVHFFKIWGLFENR